MTVIGDNAPPPAGWHPDPRACPFDDCDVCGSDRQKASGFGTYPTIPPNITLGVE